MLNTYILLTDIYPTSALLFGCVITESTGWDFFYRHDRSSCLDAE